MQKYFETNLIDCGDRIGDEVVVAVSTIPSTGLEIVVRIGFFELPQFTDKIMLTSTPVAIAFTCEGKCKYYATTQKALYQLVLPRDGETYGLSWKSTRMTSHFMMNLCGFRQAIWLKC